MCQKTGLKWALEGEEVNEKFAIERKFELGQCLGVRFTDYHGLHSGFS